MYNWKRRTDEQTAIIPMARWIFMSALAIRILIANSNTRRAESSIVSQNGGRVDFSKNRACLFNKE
jgi:hypothetical protein